MVDACHILLVEDNSDAAAMLRSFLTLKGYTCTVCPDGQSALAAVETLSPTALILDVGLPSLSGVELARTLRARPDSARFTLIGYSGYGRDQDREQALAAGMDAYFVKPADVNEILAAIQRVAAGRGAG